MTQEEFKELFFDVFPRYVKIPREVEKMYDDVVRKYSAKGRHYHNLNHIISMCDSWRECHTEFENPDLVFIAIVYHDIIYSTRRFDNEDKSADYVHNLLFKKFVDLRAGEIGFIKDLIRYTKHNSDSETILSDDVKLLLDLDLMVLSASWDRYLEYAQNVRKEYRIYPNFLYKKGRLDFLEKFLKKENIYLSNRFKKLEKIARQNIENEIIYLTSPKKRKKDGK